MDSLGGSGVISVAFAIGFVVVMFGAVVQSTSGVGFGLVAAPLLVLIDPDFVPGTVIFLGIVVSLLSTLRDARDVNATLVAAGIAGRLPAAILAASLLASLSEVLFQIIFAALILLAVPLSLFGPSVRPSVPGVALAGVLSGFMGTLTSVGAPPFAIALQNAPPHQMRATLNAVLLLGACVSLVSLAAFDRFGWADIMRGIALLPAVFLGYHAARFIIRAPATASWLRPAVLGLCLLASVVLILRASAALAVS
ncbi:MAG: sulfite exporter TauE/SafE family protein [Pseudomonadota bacterium]